jgi:hypothetical protein
LVSRSDREPRLGLAARANAPLAGTEPDDRHHYHSGRGDKTPSAADPLHHVCVLSLAASLLAGYGMAGGKARSWLHMIGFCAVVVITVYVIMDIEYPRLGLIRVDDADRVLL